MSEISKGHLGLAGEFRVMSKLLLLGHNPAKSYLEKGPDLILENGIRIEIKAAHKRITEHIDGHEYAQYFFSLQGGRRKKQELELFDFIICWCVDEDIFYVIPAEIVKSSGVAIGNTGTNAKHKYKAYKERWDLLNRGGI